MVFPEGSRGFIKPFCAALQAAAVRHRLRAAGAADQDADRAGRDRRLRGAEPGADRLEARSRKLIGAPAFPVTWFFPWLGLLGFLPLPVKYRIHFGDPIRFEGDANDDDESIARHVDRVKDEISLLIEEGLAQREGLVPLNELEPVVWLIVFVISITAHEAAHALGRVSGRRPDRVPGRTGQPESRCPTCGASRSGMVLIPLITTFTNGLPIGWASTPVRPALGGALPAPRGLDGGRGAGREPGARRSRRCVALRIGLDDGRRSRAGAASIRRTWWRGDADWIDGSAASCR